MRLLLIIFSLFILSCAYGEYEKVSLQNIDLPANDLFHPDYGEIDPEFAYELYKEGHDLSKLDPVQSDLWSGQDSFNSFVDQELPIHSGDTLSYNSVITSPVGIMRFNALKDGLRVQVHLSKRLHTVLLRKNLFRKLGYNIPAMKYLKKLTITFDSEEQKNFFKDVELYGDVTAAASRWIVDESPQSLTLQDLYIKIPSETEKYDVALTMPTEELSSRALRASLGVYALLDMGESVNKFSYKSVNVEDGKLILGHDTQAKFNTTIDDLRWIGDKLAKLSREDIVQIVRRSYFPPVVEKILIEKILARLNNLLETLGVNYTPHTYQKDLKLEGVKDGYLFTQTFKGYASRYSHGIQKGPLDDLWRYAFAEAQSSAISSLAEYASDELVAFNPSKARFKWFEKDFQKHKDEAIKHFQEYGEFPALPFSSWASPLVNGQVIMGRDIVIGSALGTDNFVQLADSVGFEANLGAYVGLERVFSQVVSGSVVPSISARVTYTHVKPIASLKTALANPYKNILVNWLVKRFRNSIEDVVTTTSQAKITPKERKKEVKELFEDIEGQLSVGDSLIISQSINPDFNTSIRTPIFQSATLNASIGAKYRLLKRVQIIRRTKYDFDVYVDDGNALDLYSRGGLSYLIPIIIGSSKRSYGKMNMKYFKLNLNPNESANPGFYSDATRLINIIKNKGVEEEDSANAIVSTKSSDRSTKLSILFLVQKYLKKMSDLFVKSPGADDTRYVSATYEKQGGINYKNLAKDIANYLLDLHFPFFSFSKDPFENAGRSFLGTSYTHSTRFEAKFKDIELNPELSNLSNLYAISIKREEGGAIRENKLWRTLKKENERLDYDLFSLADAQDAGDLSMYKVESRIHLYNNAIDKLLTLSKSELTKLSMQVQSKKASTARCYNHDDSRSTTISRALSCGDFSYILRKRSSCNKLMRKKKYDKAYRCVAQYLSYFTSYVDTKSLATVVGEENIYVEGLINGFRKTHEYLYRPIFAGSRGRQNDIYKRGPLESIQNFLGVSKGEFYGNWYRERL